MRILIVDDEPLARRALAQLVARRGEVTGFDEARDAVHALELLACNSYDLLMLDIQMPEMSGLDLADHLKQHRERAPSIIFVTAFHEHAIAAFEKHAVDYILKPFAQERVHQAILRAMQRSQEERACRLLAALENLRGAAPPPQRVAIKVKGRILFVEPSELITAEARGNYVLLHQKAGSLLLRESISTVGEMLAPHGFVRIHRSVLVNSLFVESIEPSPSGEYLVSMKTGKEYSVSRGYKDNLRALADHWMGTDAPGDRYSLA
ncbi:MAG: LytR/AlgR family response regulator transcription factor [Acidobacteriota bacterium]